jgi:gamma-glutamylcyclotransferase (GGCT)/AIG2-like uncharacterized protein YtfP
MFKIVPVFFYALRKSKYDPPKTRYYVEPVFAIGKLYGNYEDAYLLKGSDIVYGEYMLIDENEFESIRIEHLEYGWIADTIETSRGLAYAFYYVYTLPSDAVKITSWTMV